MFKVHCRSCTFRTDYVRRANAIRRAASHANVNKHDVDVVEPQGADEPDFQAAHVSAAGVVSIAHGRDADCTVDPETDTCTTCGVFHGDPCRLCGGRGFHKAGCGATDGACDAAPRPCYYRDGQPVTCAAHQQGENPDHRTGQDPTRYAEHVKNGAGWLDRHR